MKVILTALIKFYRKHVSAGLKRKCIYTPSCSQYAMDALEKHGTFKAVWLIIFRLLRCNRLSKGGLDPVPDSKKVLKWLY